MQEKPGHFDALNLTDVFQPAGKSRVDVITLDAESTRYVGFLSSPVTPETLEHELDHVALTVMRRRHMGKNQQLHTNR
jgi:hypothetical protein